MSLIGIPPILCCSLTIGSLRDHDDDDNKNVTNLNIWQWKTAVLHALHVHFSFLNISQTFSFFPRREMTCFADVWTTRADDDKIMSNFICLPLKRWFQFNSRILRTYLASVMTLNNWEMFAETRSYIFRWGSRCRRRRLYLRSLISDIGR